MNRRNAPSPPIAAADPDARAVRATWIAWAIATAIFVLIYWVTPRERMLLMPIAAALLLLWPLWRGGRMIWQQMLDASMQPWQGNYYEFDGRQVRVLVDDLDDLWFAAADVFDALELDAGARDVARVRLAAGRDGLRPAPGERLLCFTERGLTAFLERRTDVRTASFQRWLQTQVIRPHRRRQEIAESAPAQKHATEGRQTDTGRGE